MYNLPVSHWLCYAFLNNRTFNIFANFGKKLIRIYVYVKVQQFVQNATEFPSDRIEYTTTYFIICIIFYLWRLEMSTSIKCADDTTFDRNRLRYITHFMELQRRTSSL